MRLRQQPVLLAATAFADEHGRSLLVAFQPVREALEETEAQAYQNDIVPRARGEAARITAEAEGARQASIAEATGQTQRFLSVLSAYKQAREVTMQRMYLETMQEILGHSPTLVIDEKFKGLMPLLPLADRAGTTAGAQPGPAPAGGTASAPPPLMAPAARSPIVRGAPQ